MKNKYICTSICAVAMSAILSLTVYAAPLNSSVSCTVQQETVRGEKLTEEQKAVLKAKYEEIEKKWDALSGKQKESIYKLKDKELEAETKIIDKYLEYGIIDKEHADHIKQKISELKSSIRENGNMPGHYKKYKQQKSNPQS